MAARKATSVFLIVETPNHQRNAPGMPPTSLSAWRLPIEGKDTVEDVVTRHYESQPAGSTVYAVDDSKVQGFTVGVRLDQIDDVRIKE